MPPQLCRRKHIVPLSPVCRASVKGIGDRLEAASKGLYRSFAWRRTRDPFKVGVAEILLQKTRAEAAQPVFVRLLERYPNASELARADANELAVLIAHLGLSSKRVRGLLAFARDYEARGAAIFERPFSEHTVPGLGAYGYRAVRAFTQDIREGIVDANVRRVFDRVFSLRHRCEGRYQAIADRIVSGSKSSRTLNFAVLDLAARFCLPRPRCQQCPLHDQCRSSRSRASSGTRHVLAVADAVQQRSARAL